MITDVFLDQKRVNVCEHIVKTVPHESFGKLPPEGCKTGRWEEGKLNGALGSSILVSIIYGYGRDFFGAYRILQC
jgi:hypothetical protein